MSYSRDEVVSRATRYATKNGVVLERELGFGVHGIVWSSNRKTAIKVHAPASIYYYRERDIYLRLKDLDISKVLGFRVPRLLDYDDDLWAIEIAIVHPPFVLDFAGALLDRRPDYSDEVWADWRSEKARAVRCKLAQGSSGRRGTRSLRHLHERRFTQQYPLCRINAGTISCHARLLAAGTTPR